MASFWFDEGLYQIATGGKTWTGSTIKCRLLKNTASPAKTDTSMTALTKVTGTTDQTVVSKAAAKDTSNHLITFTGGTITWSAVPSGETEMGAVFYVDVDGTDANAIPLFWNDATDLATNGGDFTLAPHATNKFGYLSI